jgi:hypothetical protein
MRSPQESFGSVGDRDELLAASMHVYREWSFGGQMGPRLTGLHAMPAAWPNGAELHAECYRPGFAACTDAPNPDCQCGIYGYYRPDEAWTAGGYYGGLHYLYGVAQVAGRCLLGSRGLRAARARVLAVATTASADCDGTCPWWRYTQNALRRRYPSVRVFSSRDALLEVYPPSDWESLVGDIAPSPQKAYRAVLHSAEPPALYAGGGVLAIRDVIRANANRDAP